MYVTVGAPVRTELGLHMADLVEPALVLHEVADPPDDQ
jgi:hypothetical protein